MSELLDREHEIRAAAKDCEIVQDLCRVILVRGKPCPISFAIRANEEFDLGLETLRPDRVGSKRVAQAVPKPKGKGAKPE